MGPLAAVLAILALGIASCGGGGDTTETEGSATVEEGANGAESELESTPQESAPPPSGNAPRAEKVEIENFAYNPDPVTIQEGGKVIWINRDSAPHTATADDGSFDTGELAGRQDQVGDLQGSRGIHLLLPGPPGHARHDPGGARRVVSPPGS